MTTIVPLGRDAADPLLALDLLARHCRDNADRGFTVPAEECLPLAALFERLAVRLLADEGRADLRRARDAAEASLASLGTEPDVVDLGARTAAIATGKVVAFQKRPRSGAPS